MNRGGATLRWLWIAGPLVGGSLFWCFMALVGKDVETSEYRQAMQARTIPFQATSILLYLPLMEHTILHLWRGLSPREDAPSSMR